jgi:hypothetical protein
MLVSNWDAGQAEFVVIASAAIAGIIAYLVRAFRRRDQKPWPAFFVGIYCVVLLLLFLFGIITQVESEGFGFLPLMALTTPWSWLIPWLLKCTNVLDSGSLGNNILAGQTLFYSAIFVLPGAANSCILYYLLKRSQKKTAEDEAWKQARWNR